MSQGENILNWSFPFPFAVPWQAVFYFYINSIQLFLVAVKMLLYKYRGKYLCYGTNRYLQLNIQFWRRQRKIHT